MLTNEKKIDCLVIGGAGVDTFIFPKEAHLINDQGIKEIAFPFGSKVALKNIFSEVGGGGANTAVGLARHGLKIAFLTKLGDDENGKLVLQRLREEHVKIEYLKYGSKPTGSSIVIQGIGRDRTIFTYRGSNSDLNEHDVTHALLTQCKFVLINALYDQSSNLIPAIIKKSEGLHVKIALSLGKNEILFQGNQLFQVFPSIYLLVLNQEESKLLYHVLTGNVHKKEIQCIACRQKTNTILQYLKNLGIQNVGITLGSSGVKFIAENNKIYTIASKKADVVNTTGLGDAFYAGLLAYLIQNKRVDYAIKHGIDNAVSVMGFLGAQIGLLRD